MQELNIAYISIQRSPHASLLSGIPFVVCDHARLSEMSIDGEVGDKSSE